MEKKKCFVGDDCPVMGPAWMGNMVVFVTDEIVLRFWFCMEPILKFTPNGEILK